jgi:nucleotide-binding universal stress UspA family protein
MFTHILLALEDSPAGEVAVVFAGALARRTGASVHVLHVNERLIGGNGVTVRSRDEATDLVTAAVDQLARAGARTGGSVRVSGHRGVADVIASCAHERSADAIVLGSQRRRRLGRFLAGDVRSRTTRLTALPVITAPSPLRMARRAMWREDLTGLDQTLDSLLH